MESESYAAGSLGFGSDIYLRLPCFGELVHWTWCWVLVCRLLINYFLDSHWHHDVFEVLAAWLRD